MPKCKICGSRMADGMAKCPVCGAPSGSGTSTVPSIQQKPATMARQVMPATCPQCGGKVIGEHRLCPHCGANLKAAAAASMRPQVQPVPVHAEVPRQNGIQRQGNNVRASSCPSCGTVLKVQLCFCPQCGANLQQEGQHRQESNSDFEIDGTTLVYVKNEELRHVVIPDFITVIDEWAFEDCNQVESIHIPDSVTIIGRSAFSDCGESLRNINIPSSVTEIAGGAFTGCPHVSISISGQNYTVENSLLIDKRTRTVVSCISDEEKIEIPDYITGIAEEAFWSCDSLEILSIPDSITSIGKDAFEYCDSLCMFIIREYSRNDSYMKKWVADNGYDKSIEKNGCAYFADSRYYATESFCTQDGLFKIEKRRISCPIGIYVEEQVLVELVDKKLRQVSIPDFVTTIGDKSFWYCQSLKSINISESVATIGDNAFTGCHSLKNIIIPESVTTIGKESFVECPIDNVSIPHSVISIGEMAFLGCPIKNLSISEGIVTIGVKAFKSCRLIKSITIPRSIKTIGNFAFDNCISLKSITIPQSVTYIGEGVFHRCLNVSIIIEGNNYAITDSLLIDKRTERLVESLSKKSHVDIPMPVMEIGSNAFFDCVLLKTVNIPLSVICLDEYCFSYCTSLESIFIPDSVTCIKKKAFLNCTSLKNISIPDSIASIGDNIFEDCVFLDTIVIRQTAQSKNVLQKYVTEKGFIYKKQKRDFVFYKRDVKISERITRSAEAVRNNLIPWSK